MSMHVKQWRTSWLWGLFSLSLMLGLVFARFDIISLRYQFILAVGVIALPFLVKKRLVACLPVICIGLGLGVYRANMFISQLHVYDMHNNEEITINAHVQSDPVYTDTGQNEFFVDAIQINNKQTIPGRIRVRSFNANVQRGDRVQIHGTLRNGFASWQGAIYYAGVETLNVNTSAIHRFRQRFIATIYSVLPDPEASLGLGFLIGIRTLLPEELESQLSVTGLTHIVAVSGYNLTILILLTRRIFMRYSRYLALITSLGLLALFLIITGVSPSIVRASIVSILSLTAWYFGRQFNPLLLLLFSGVVTAYANPLYIWGDLGWYLSFLAFFGVLVLAPLVTKMLYKKRSPGLVGQIFLETTMAQIMTAPLIMLVFKQFSAISLLANLIILPLIPLAMLGTFLSGIFALISAPISGIVVLPTNYLLTFITNMVAVLAHVPWALQKISLSTIQFVISLLITALFWLVLYITFKRRNIKTHKSDILVS